MFKLSAALLVFVALVALVAANDNPELSMPGVVDLTVENFATTVQGKNFLVEFYAPWCGWCKRLVPVWKELGAKVGNHESVGIAKFDATLAGSDDIKNTYGIRGFPTILLLRADGRVEKFASERTTEGFLKFITEHTGVEFTEKKVEEEQAEKSEASTGVQGGSGTVIALNPTNFDSIVKDSSKHVFVKFFAPWCGHCVRMADAWKELAANLKDNKDVIIAELDASEHGQTATAYGVRGFPTLKLFTKSDKSGDVAYRGARDTPSFEAFLKQNNVA